MPESVSAEKTGGKPPAVLSARQLWATTCSRVAVIAGVFSLVLGVLLVINSLHLYQGPGNGRLRLIESGQLLPLKTALRNDPKNEALKQQIRQLDRQLRHEYFRREQIAGRGGWLLMGSVAVFLIALKTAAHLKRPPLPVPGITARREDPARSSAIAARAVAGSAIGLAALATALVWDAHRQWRDLPVSEAPAASGSEEPAAINPDWFPDAAEVARNWGRFRGPDGSGVPQFEGLPESWDGPSGRNVLWKSPVDLPGENSPVIWGDRLFVTGATDKRREVYCFDTGTGAMLWKEPVGTPESTRAEAPDVMEETGFAAPTAATDGRRVFAIFANGDIAAFSYEGKRLWIRSLGTPENMYGHAASLALWRNRVIVVYDQGDTRDDLAKIMALDSTTGGTVWSTPRPVANSWVSPILINHQGREQVITSADPWVIAYDPATGQEIWKAKCMKGDVAPSPVYANELVYLACDQTYVLAIRPDGSGDVTDSKIVWKQDEAGLPDTCSLLCDGPRVYTLVFGVLHAFDALTGEHLWEHEFEAEFTASPALINGRIHLSSTAGTMIIGEGGADGFKETGRAELGEKATGASPAFSPGRIYLRGRKHLFCIGTKDEP